MSGVESTARRTRSREQEEVRLEKPRSKRWEFRQRIHSQVFKLAKSYLMRRVGIFLKLDAVTRQACRDSYRTHALSNYGFGMT